MTFAMTIMMTIIMSITITFAMTITTSLFLVAHLAHNLMRVSVGVTDMFFLITVYAVFSVLGAGI